MSEPTAPAIATHRLTKYYGTRKVVDSLDLAIAPGTVYGLLGRNGAGKSTLLKMLVGMVQPSYGHARLLGEDSASLSPALQRRIAYLAEGHPLYGWMNLDEAARLLRPMYPTWNQSLFEQIVDHFGLRRKTKLGRLSKGEQAQVSLALAIAPDPELLILDDPTLGLDTVVRRDFLESMIHIIQRRGRTILFSSHILGDVERVADRIGVLADGVLRADCPTEVFKTQVRKIVLEFDREPPPVTAWPGLVSERQVHMRRELIVVGYGPAEQAALEALSPKRLEMVELNLEDAFIEYTRGPRRPLPIFSGSNGDVESTGTQRAT